MNKHLSVLSLAISIVALGLVFWRMPASPETAKKETAYDRVMRTRTLRCGYALWPSETEIDPNTKQLKGIVPDFAKAVTEKLGLKIEWTQELLWGQQAEALKTGKIDAICASDGPWVTSGAAFVDYAEPMLYIPIYVYGREGETRFKTPADMNKPDITFSTMDGDMSLSLAGKIPAGQTPGIISIRRSRSHRDERHHRQSRSCSHEPANGRGCQ